MCRRGRLTVLVVYQSNLYDTEDAMSRILTYFQMISVMVLAIGSSYSDVDKGMAVFAIGYSLCIPSGVRMSSSG